MEKARADKNEVSIADLERRIENLKIAGERDKNNSDFAARKITQAQHDEAEKGIASEASGAAAKISSDHNKAAAEATTKTDTATFDNLKQQIDLSKDSGAISELKILLIKHLTLSQDITSALKIIQEHQIPELVDELSRQKAVGRNNSTKIRVLRSNTGK